MDEDWKLVDVEPEAVAVSGNGTNGNGHHEGFDVGPTVELVPARGIHANDNGHHEEADEPQRSLFSWAEFMAEEPVKPKARRDKVQAPSLPLFGWAAEREREAELVGAGR